MRSFKSPVLRNNQGEEQLEHCGSSASVGPRYRSIPSSRKEKHCFQAIGYERELADGTGRIDTAIALVMGELAADPPLTHIHSQCFTGELGSIRCDCSGQLELALQSVAAEGRGVVIYEH
jgi:GTP cyclohydrolase II